jgi:hypothetical protein
MKIRVGFVSNSSSSSFCIYKKLMTNDQIDEFKRLIKDAYCSDDETNIYESGSYFVGRLSMHDCVIHNFIEQNFKSGDYAIEN